MDRLESKRAIVTGGGSGIGRSIALRLASEGARIVLADLDENAANTVSDEISDETLVQRVDVTKAADMEALVARVVSEWGGLDVMVNNAGVGVATALEDETLDWFRTVMEVNVTASWHLAKLARDALIAAGSGAIVNVASMLGQVGSTPVKQASYCASKGAVINMTRELALQFARKNVRVNALCPGWFPSEMTEDMQADDAQAFIKVNGPMPRMGEAHELDGALLLLAGPAGTFLTGQSIIVDGGWTAR